jgi:hypothetical protein
MRKVRSHEGGQVQAQKVSQMRRPGHDEEGGVIKIIYLRGGMNRLIQ